MIFRINLCKKRCMCEWNLEFFFKFLENFQNYNREQKI